MAEVLIVDDSPVMRRLVRELLASDPYLTFSEAEDGLAALARIRTHCPDVVILDVTMPRLNGLELYRLLKADPVLAAIPIVVISGQWTVAPEFVGLAGCLFIQKPFEEHAFVSAVRGVLGTSLQ